ncbi:hypothetical protein OIU77_004269 [Salix suchowensis]|uniref:Uncharacterized protein n=1 Tax=Salix suchowensis TaxID=1278906 RepID=A0ABQ9AVA9_9ROSI|nr:hypothetical protein OIU77_004269 [Salix suchowensis]
MFLRLQSCLHIPNDASGSYALVMLVEIRRFRVMKMFHHELFHSNNPQVLFMDVYEKMFPIRTSWSSFIASVSCSKLFHLLLHVY